MSAAFRATYAGRASWGGFMFNCGLDSCLVLRDTESVRQQMLAAGLEISGEGADVGTEVLFEPAERQQGRGLRWTEFMLRRV